MDGSGVMIMELILWVGGLGVLFWLDRRNLNRAKADAARHAEREAEAGRRAGTAPALVPTLVPTATGAGPSAPSAPPHRDQGDARRQRRADPAGRAL